MQLRLTIEYEGTRYLGWQVQPGGATIQGVLEDALATALRTPVRVRGAGRTDAGVHAYGQVATASIAEAPSDLRKLMHSLNALTPPDVAIRELEVVGDDFDPRRHARSRLYEYRILTGPPSAFWRRYAWRVGRELDAASMALAAPALEGEHDFAAFTGADSDAEGQSTVRRVFESSLRVEPPLLVYRIEGTAFLKHMVRNVVGTLTQIGLGERPADDLARVLARGDRRLAGPTAPPHGLVLVAVRY